MGNSYRSYRWWKLRCCTYREFVPWYATALRVRDEPVCLRLFCDDAEPGWCRGMAKQGKCLKGVGEVQAGN